mgnify:CR=1 FL=1
MIKINVIGEFLIKAKLPSLNDYIDVNRRGKYKANQFKSEVEELIGWAIKQAQTKGSLKPTDKAITVYFEWHEKTKMRDADNIVSAKKYILDAMQKCGIIPNDNRRYVKGFYDVIIDDTEDFVLVKLLEKE